MGCSGQVTAASLRKRLLLAGHRGLQNHREKTRVCATLGGKRALQKLGQGRRYVSTATIVSKISWRTQDLKKKNRSRRIPSVVFQLATYVLGLQANDDPAANKADNISAFLRPGITQITIIINAIIIAAGWGGGGKRDQQEKNKQTNSGGIHTAAWAIF